MDYFEELIQSIVIGETSSRDEVLRLKARLCKKYGLSKVPPNYAILEHVPEEYREVVEPYLRNKPSRTLSGVAPVAVMTSPCDCPHGKCSYCPGGVSKNTPQSYTGHEPAALRGGMYQYDPFLQTKSRIAQLRAIGHSTDKVDLIIMGGTFTSRQRDYQDWFVKRCFDAMNGTDSADLEASQVANETAKSRCIGLTVETRPDWFRSEQVNHALNLGATKVELGVQILDDDVLDGVKRGHHISEVVEATQISKDAGLKVAYHMMPGLPGSSREKDLASFRSMIEDERFRPDMLKIYPTLVVKDTELYELWRSGRYSPPPLEETVKLLAELKSFIPPWLRILRIQRDIPVQLIESGVKKSHLREIVADEMHADGKKCRCIRCREVGRSQTKAVPEQSDVELGVNEYAASGGKEVFLSYEVPSEDCLIGYARLRLVGDGRSPARVRELHVYGEMVPISEMAGSRWQHRGFGEKLLNECEKRAAKQGYESIEVTSGVGARNYYRRLGYERKGPYMAKDLRIQ